MQNIVHLISSQPQLLLNHAQAYGDLVSQEFAQASLAWKRRLIYSCVALLLASIATTLLGAALMLWAITPASQIHSAWLLWAVPLIPFSAALWCAKLARSYSSKGAFKNFRSQISADIAMFSQSGQLGQSGNAT